MLMKMLVVFDLLINLAVKNHLNLLGFLHCGLCVSESKAADGWHVVTPKHSSTTLLPLPLGYHCTQVAHGTAKKAKWRPTCVEPSLIRIWWQRISITETQRIKYALFVPPWSDRKRWDCDTAVWRQNCSAHVCTHFASSSHPDLSKPQSLTSLLHRCLITRSEQRIIPTSSVSKSNHVLYCCT